MNRRNFLGGLAALPVVGRFVPKAWGADREIWGYYIDPVDTSDPNRHWYFYWKPMSQEHIAHTIRFHDEHPPSFRIYKPAVFFGREMRPPVECRDSHVLRDRTSLNPAAGEIYRRDWYATREPV